MATQAALIADTIIGMKRALRRERDDSGPDDPIMQPTNRGNKMKANAKYVREGAMGFIHAEEFYREKIEHAGYTRHILQRNPIRYDSEGDELDEEDEDSEADTAAAEENPFSGIALETLLCPLKHPSELPTHPSLSQAYTSQALEQMAGAVEEKLRQEKALLWRARNLHRQFLGDAGWMPCGAVEAPEDRYIFEPRTEDENSRGSTGQQKPRKRITPQMERGGELQTTENDVEMAEYPADSGITTANIETREPSKALKSEEADATVNDLPPHPKGADEPQRNGNNLSRGGYVANDKPDEMDISKDGEKADAKRTNGDPNETYDETEQDAEMHDGSSPEPPRRMTTRARANAANPQDENQSPSSETASTFLTPHPLFLIPDNVRPDANFGLPATEAEETRRLLWSYIQKQEETVRGFENMLNSLFRACHMKANVLEWCKAEGHVGEMSDGEDWYDREKWGLAEGEDLKKGTDEDEVETVDDSRTTAKRGRGRRA
ncbi:hypothetical protein N7494_010187 [Penicillium frequentans]|uniref:Transcriptional regulatory protein RXT2 N-terminal domain-containing protein n=1 Tax=Penicillium frequentans TaxID=3151616 RepID=A0AAD6CRE7_9EURO|nr:hypothetical protein N7494_010187 [Penicillium glabrum]